MLLPPLRAIVAAPLIFAVDAQRRYAADMPLPPLQRSCCYKSAMPMLRAPRRAPMRAAARYMQRAAP